MPLRHLCHATLLLIVSVLTACGSGQKTGADKAAKAEPVAHEAELLKITLSPSAIERLGVATSAADEGTAVSVLSLHGEIVLPPSGGGVAISSASDLAMLAANQARADGDVSRTRAELDIARKNAARAEALVREEAGSLRIRDEALAAAAVAGANANVAQTQRAQYGPPILVINRAGRVWVRVTIPSGDLPKINRSADVQITLLGSTDGARSARPVDGPPSANAAAATVDLYYALDNLSGSLRLGQRVSVTIPTAGQLRGLSISASAILHDIYGGEWVYVATGKQSFERRRIEVASLQGGRALLARGLQPGARVVTAGAAELFGTEFGTK